MVKAAREADRLLGIRLLPTPSPTAPRGCGAWCRPESSGRSSASIWSSTTFTFGQALVLRPPASPAALMMEPRGPPESILPAGCWTIRRSAAFGAEPSTAARACPSAVDSIRRGHRRRFRQRLARRPGRGHRRLPGRELEQPTPAATASSAPALLGSQGQNRFPQRQRAASTLRGQAHQRPLRPGGHPRIQGIARPGPPSTGPAASPGQNSSIPRSKEASG